MPRWLQVVLESDGNVTKYKPMAVYTLVAFFRSKIGIKLMKLHVFLLGWSISTYCGYCTVYSIHKNEKKKKEEEKNCNKGHRVVIC